ncbi:MAG TPA: hypothetical protein VME44_21270 [Streptosporangiaceae bacterium]|nr:hypothetical protein [Streptosporangiaceae bacterium]
MKPILAQPAARAAAAILATAAVLLAAACSGSRPSTHSAAAANTTGSVASKQRAYASCMRSHGVAHFPDPDSSGGFDKATLAQLAASNSQYRAANQTCGHLLPAGSSSGRTPAQERQEWSGMLKFARCMRSHGEPNWPDPTPYPPYPSDPTYMLPASIQPVPQTISKMEECLRLVPMSYALGHIDNPDWQSAQQQMAGL